MAHSIDSSFKTASVSCLKPRCRTCGIPVKEGVTYCDDICDTLQLTDEMVKEANTRRDGVNWWVKAGYKKKSI